MRQIRKRERRVGVTVDGKRHEGFLTEYQVVDGRKIVSRHETREAADRWISNQNLLHQQRVALAKSPTNKAPTPR